MLSDVQRYGIGTNGDRIANVYYVGRELNFVNVYGCQNGMIYILYIVSNAIRNTSDERSLSCVYLLGCLL